MNLTINSTFKPITMDERLKPLILYQKAYQEQENALAELESQASVWEKLADSAQDEDVYNQYLAYANSVRNQADAIARTGLTPGSRKAMLDLKARYNKDIDPIEKAWNERDRQYKLQQEMMLKDPTHRFRQSANEIGLRNYMNQQYDALADNFSGAVLEEQASKAAANLKATLRDKSKLQSLGLPYQYEQKLKYGYTPEEIDKAINGDSDADPILLNIIDNVLESSGVNGWGNDRLSREARAFAGRGLFSALGTDKIEHYTDQYNMSVAINSANQREAFKYKMLEKQLENQGTGDPWNSLTHWEGTIKDDNNASQYTDVYNRLVNNYGHLKRRYSGDKNGNFVNPMKMYEEVQNYLKTHNKTIDDKEAENYFKNTKFMTPGANYGYNAARKRVKYEEAVEAIKNKYGVIDIISEDDYNKLATLGYTSNSTGEDMRGASIQRRIDGLANSYWATRTDLSKYDHVAEKILPELRNREETGTFEAYTYDNGKKGKKVSYEDMMGYKSKDYSSKSKLDHLSDVAYSVQNPDYILVTVHGKRYYIDPSTHSAEAAKIIKESKELLKKYTSPEDRAEIQNQTAYALQLLFNRYSKVRSETDSKI